MATNNKRLILILHLEICTVGDLCARTIWKVFPSANLLIYFIIIIKYCIRLCVFVSVCVFCFHLQLQFYIKFKQSQAKPNKHRFYIAFLFVFNNILWFVASEVSFYLPCWDEAVVICLLVCCCFFFVLFLNWNQNMCARSLCFSVFVCLPRSAVNSIHRC